MLLILLKQLIFHLQKSVDKLKKQNIELYLEKYFIMEFVL